MRDSFHLHENFNGRSCLLFYFFFANFSFSTIYPLIFSGKRHEFHIVPFKKIFFQAKDFVDNFTVIYCQCLQVVISILQNLYQYKNIYFVSTYFVETSRNHIFKSFLRWMLRKYLIIKETRDNWWQLTFFRFVLDFQ